MGKNRAAETQTTTNNSSPGEILLCDLGMTLFETGRHLQFFPRVELEKLKTCYRFHELDEHLRLEQSILRVVFQTHPQLSVEQNPRVVIPLTDENIELIHWIEQYASIEFLRSKIRQGRGDEAVTAVTLTIERDTKGIPYISYIDILQKD